MLRAVDPLECSIYVLNGAALGICDGTLFNCSYSGDRIKSGTASARLSLHFLRPKLLSPLYQSAIDLLSETLLWFGVRGNAQNQPILSGFSRHIFQFSFGDSLRRTRCIMQRLRITLFLVVLAVALSGAQQPKRGTHKKPNHAPAAYGFNLRCANLPFDNIATKPDPLAKCGNCEVVSTSAPPNEVAAKAAQSNAKNNFCADTSKITVVTIADLRDLQRQAANLVITDLPDRSRVRGVLNNNPIVEGSVVRLVAWVKDAHFSDCGSGEEVNCKISGSAHNDIHIVL